MVQPTRSILFITLSCVGDAIMTTPLLEALHHHFPEARIDIVADKRSAILFQHCPYRTKTLIKDKKKLLRGSVSLLRELWKTNYDVIVDVRTDGMAYLCRGQERYTKWQRKPYGPHAVEQLMGVIHRLHGQSKIPPTTVWIAEEEQNFADSALLSLPPGRWLYIAPAVALSSKAWPVENYIRLVNGIGDIFTGVILDGSPSEFRVTNAVARGLKVPYVNLAGKTNLLQAAAVLHRASLFVGSDSGLGHIASAVATPTLTFFSNDKPERVLPWGNQAVWLSATDGQVRSISVEAAEKKIRGVFLHQTTID